MGRGRVWRRRPHPVRPGRGRAAGAALPAPPLAFKVDGRGRDRRAGLGGEQQHAVVPCAQRGWPRAPANVSNRRTGRRWGQALVLGPGACKRPPPSSLLHRTKHVWRCDCDAVSLAVSPGLCVAGVGAPVVFSATTATPPPPYHLFASPTRFPVCAPRCAGARTQNFTRACCLESAAAACC